MTDAGELAKMREADSDRTEIVPPDFASASSARRHGQKSWPWRHRRPWRRWPRAGPQVQLCHALEDRWPYGHAACDRHGVGAQDVCRDAGGRPRRQHLELPQHARHPPERSTAEACDNVAAAQSAPILTMAGAQGFLPPPALQLRRSRPAPALAGSLPKRCATALSNRALCTLPHANTAH